MKLTTTPQIPQWKGRPCYQFDHSVGCHGSNGRGATLTDRTDLTRTRKTDMTSRDDRCRPHAPVAENPTKPDITATALSSIGQTVRSSSGSLRRPGCWHHRDRTIRLICEDHPPTADAEETAGNSRKSDIGRSGRYYGRRRHGPAWPDFPIALLSAPVG
jgi:hypothetical protein